MSDDADASPVTEAELRAAMLGFNVLIGDLHRLLIERREPVPKADLLRLLRIREFELARENAPLLARIAIATAREALELPETVAATLAKPMPAGTAE